LAKTINIITQTDYMDRQNGNGRRQTFG